MSDSVWGIIAGGLSQYWFEATVSAGCIGIGWLVGFWRARQQWKARSFFERINISLNMLHDGKLLIRTLAERPLEDVFVNPLALTLIQRAIQKTTESNPIPPLSDEDFWPILNCVLNVISEKFSDGYIRKDLGYSMKSDNYLICLTCERSPEIRTNKIRAMVMKKSVLLDLPAHEPQYEQPSHRIRFRTLQQLAALYRHDPHQFLDIEFSL